MADVKCPSCGKSNPEALEICQYCGTLLKQTRTEPLEPFSTGEFPVKRATADLERTLPGWLRDARRAANEPSTSPIPDIKVPKPPTPPPPAKKAPASPMDLLAGLSQAGDEDEEVPDWLKNLQGETPVPAAPSKPEAAPQETKDWFAELQEQAAETEKPPQPDTWGFSSEPTTFNFDENEEPAQIGGETPDWLTKLQSQETAAPQPPAPATGDFSLPSGAESGATPDWLASLGGATPAQPVSGPAETTPASGAETPDWLAGLGGTFDASAEETPAALQSEASAETPDWLAGLGGFAASAAAPAENAPTPPAVTPPSGGDLPDWLSDLQKAPAAPAAPESPAPAAPQPPASDLPDWMAGLQETPAASEAAFSAAPEIPASEIPDWMSSLGTPAVPEIPAPIAPTTPPSDLPDWMADLQETPAAPEVAASTTPETPVSDIPDWMSSLGTPSMPATSAPAAAEIPTSDLPDWMAGLQETPAASVEPASPFSAAPETAASEVPDWMANLGTPAVPGVTAPAAPEIPASDLPDWMAGLQETPATPAPVETPLPAAETPVDGNLPNWLSTAMGETPAAPAKPAEPTPPASKKMAKPFPTGALGEIGPLGQGVPDFMAGLVPEEQTPAPMPVQPAEPGDLPDWLSGMAAGVAAASLEAGKPAPVESKKPVEAEPTPLAASAGETEAVPATSTPGEAQNIDSYLSMDVPDWLTSFTPTNETTEQPAGSQANEDADLRPADLPSWVQAMRPVETMLSGTESVEGEASEEVEKQGPLAGLHSVLPVQAELLEIRKPKAYLIKLQVNETQRAQAALLEKLLGSENTPKAVAKVKEAEVLRPIRWIIFAVLALAVLIPTVFGSRSFPAPVVPADAADPFNRFYTTVDQIPDGAPVLVVTDYQPGFAGEMEQASVPVVVNLMRKNARLAFLSTSTISTEMGERLIQKANAFFKKNNPDSSQTPLAYARDTNYIFLGYLPGGAAGVKAFAEQPQQTTGKDSVNGDVWQSAFLEKGAISTISGFAAVIVITDDPDNGRLWIEQTGKSLGDKPMLMVTSAQAGPMIQPYAVSGQLKGLVTGLEGGVLYEQKNAEAKPGNTYIGDAKALYWDGFSVAVIVAELAILIGGAWSLIEKFRARRDDGEQDEA